MTFKLPLWLYSPRQIDAISFEIDGYLEWLREEAVRAQAVTKASAPSPISAEVLHFLELFTDNNSADPGEAEKALVYLRELKQTAPLIHITLPTFATSTVKESIVAWFRNETAPHTLITFTVDSSLLGGIVVRTPNNIYDYSFAHRLIAERGRFPEIVRRV